MCRGAIDLSIMPNDIFPKKYRGVSLRVYMHRIHIHTPTYVALVYIHIYAASQGYAGEVAFTAPRGMHGHFLRVSSCS